MVDAGDSRPLLLLPRQIRRLPADLAAVIGFVLLTDLAVLVPGINDTPLRILLGLPFVLFLPGYAFVAALFPERGAPPNDDTDESPDDGATTRRGRGIDGIERVALSFGLSIAIVPLIGLILNFTPWGIRLLPVLFGVSGFTLIATAVAAVRRWELPADERFRVPYRMWMTAVRAEVFTPETRVDAALNVLLALSVVLAVASVAYAVAVPKQGEAFTEFYLLTEDDDGELVAADYPTEFVREESKPVVIGIGNHEHRPMDYVVVIELQRVAIANNTTTVREARELDRFRTHVDANETWMTTYNVTPTLEGSRLRLAFLLFVDQPPPEPTVENAYRELHLWVNVSASAARPEVGRFGRRDGHDDPGFEPAAA